MSSVPLSISEAPARGEDLTLQSSRIRSAWLFLVPMIVVMVLVAGWPLGRTIWFSLTDADLKDLSAAKFVGVANFVGEYGVPLGSRLVETRSSTHCASPSSPSCLKQRWD